MRAQTTLDFAIGAAIFLAVLLFTFSFVPGILEPFDVGGEEKPIASDRVANSLTQDLLASPREPNILDRYCTIEFFQGNDPPECPADGTTLSEQIGLMRGQSANITLLGDINESQPGTNQICYRQSLSDPRLDERPACSGSDVPLVIGDSAPESATTITARRVVWLNGEVLTLRVVLW